MLVYLVILIPLSTFIIFDFRHDNLLSLIALSYIKSAGAGEVSIGYLVRDRVMMLISSVEYVRRDPGGWNLIIFGITLCLTWIARKDKQYMKHAVMYYFYYVGFFCS